MFKTFATLVALRLPNILLLHYASAQEDSAAWEQALVDAWATIGDCQPETGMCDACGFGKYDALIEDSVIEQVTIKDNSVFLLLLTSNITQAWP